VRDDWGSGLVADTNRSTGDGDSAPCGKEAEGCREKEREPTDAPPGEPNAETLSHGGGPLFPQR